MLGDNLTQGSRQVGPGLGENLTQGSLQLGLGLGDILTQGSRQVGPRKHWDHMAGRLH